MRNQSWFTDGTLVEDEELYLDGDKLMFRDHLKNIVREATQEEINVFNAYNAKPRDLEAELDELKARVDAIAPKS